MMQIGKYILVLNNNATYTIQWRDGEYCNTIVDSLPVKDIEYAIEMALLPKWLPIYEAANMFHEMVQNPEAWSETEKGKAILGQPGEIPPHKEGQTAEQNFQWTVRLILNDYNKLNNCNIKYEDLEKLCLRDFRHFQNKQFRLQ